MRRTKEEAEQTREAILDAAEQVFYDHGVAGGTLEEIARVAGVTRGAVYWHFENKLAIFLAIGERAVLPQEDAFRRLAETAGDDPLERLEHCLADTCRSYGADRPTYMRLTVVMLRCDYVGDMAGALHGHAAVAGRLCASIQRYFRDAMVPRCDASGWEPDVLGRTLFTIMHGAVMLWLRDPGAFPLDGTGLDAVRTFTGLVRSQWQPHARHCLALQHTYMDVCID